MNSKTENQIEKKKTKNHGFSQQLPAFVLTAENLLEMTIDKRTMFACSLAPFICMQTSFVSHNFRTVNLSGKGFSLAAFEFPNKLIFVGISEMIFTFVFNLHVIQVGEISSSFLSYRL